MNRTALFATTAILALTAGGSSAVSHPRPFAKTSRIYSVRSRGTVLYNQNSNYGNSIVSQNFTSGSLAAYDSAAADDFVVPRHKTWKVTGVDVAGEYFFGKGPASSEVITFFRNSNGHPGRVVGKPQTVNCTDTAGSFACPIKRKLTGGKRGTRYWLSVVANCDYNKCGEWGWVQNTATHGDPGQWENPGGGFGFGCSSWNNTSTCMSHSGIVDDYAFDLVGKSN